MNFTSSLFVYFFMPISLLGFLASYALSRKFECLRKIRLSDIFLVFMSFVFYGFTSLKNILFLFALILFVFLMGKWIHFTGKKRINLGDSEKSISFFILFIGVFICVFMLYLFKYAGVFSFGLFSKKWAAPLGISFLTFSAISYLFDLYRGEPEGNFLDVALYLSFFPKLISGPIVLWKDFREKLHRRVLSIDLLSEGIFEIIIGFTKKLLIADYFALVIQNIQKNSGLAIDIPTAWLICLLYMLEIYYDFAGYSNIAIGLSKFMGIRIAENFNFPYISKSISEFWRRWHISLGNWFKRYLYIPLGGNRKGKKRTLLNLFIVMFISGIWHGAGLAYLLWGVTHGLCMVFERISSKKKWYIKTPTFIKWAFTMFVVMIGWEIFRLNNFSDFIAFMSVLFGIKKAQSISFPFGFYFTRKTLFMTILAIFGATFLWKIKDSKIILNWKKKKSFLYLKYIFAIALMIASLSVIANSNYSPFIYFQY